MRKVREMESRRLALRLCLVFLASAYSLGGVWADERYLAWGANSCGGERMAGANGTAVVNLSQFAIGESASGPRMAEVGVLSAEQVLPVTMASPGKAKLNPDGARLALGGIVVTCSPSSFSDRVYAEASDRSSGIALVGGLGEAGFLQEGSRINVVGGVSTLNGERVMLNPMVSVQSQGGWMVPLIMNNSSVGGADSGVLPSGQQGSANAAGVNNVGLLVRSTGLVIDNTHPEYIVINDGCYIPFWDGGLRVSKTNLSSLPAIGNYVAVSGISGVRVRGSVLDAIVKPRSAGDLQVLRTSVP